MGPSISKYILSPRRRNEYIASCERRVRQHEQPIINAGLVPRGGYTTFVLTVFEAGFHTFALEWTPEKAVWYLDNWEVPRPLLTRFIHGRHISDADMHVILTLGVGGMGGSPDPLSGLPADFIVDYVRVYQRALQRGTGLLRKTHAS